jgi:hypothetical protein
LKSIVNNSVDVDGVHRTVYVNHSRKSHSGIDDANVNNWAIIFESDNDFGDASATNIEQYSDDDSDVLWLKMVMVTAIIS